MGCYSRIALLLFALGCTFGAKAQPQDAVLRSTINRAADDAQATERECRRTLSDPALVKQCTLAGLKARTATEGNSDVKILNGYQVVRLMGNWDLFINGQFGARFYTWEQAESLIKMLPPGPVK